MNKFIFSDIKRNSKLFIGTFFAVVLTTTIISACLNLVFSSVATFDKSERFNNVDIVATSKQKFIISYKEKDGDIDTEDESINNTIPFSESNLDKIKQNYNVIEDYSFDIQNKDIKNIVGHNISSINLSDFTLSGKKPNISEVVIDQNIALQKSLKIGDSISFKTKNGLIKYIISGIVSTSSKGIYKLQNFAFFNDDVAKEQSLGCFVVGIKTDKIKSVVKDLKKMGCNVFTGDKKYKAELTQVLNNNKSLMIIFITMGSICLVISLFVITGTIQFSVKNRYKTLALLRVIGLKKSQIKRLLVLQIIIISFVSSVIGIFLAKPVAKLIIYAYEKFNIVSNNFFIVHSYFWNIVIVLGIILLSAVLTIVTSNKPLSIAPASAIKNQSELTGKTSIVRIIVGIVLILGGSSILIFAPMTAGVGIGMGFCATSVFLAGAMCLTPIIMKFFNFILSFVVNRFKNSLGKVATANVKIKSLKFAVASVSIAIMMTLGNVMLFNNITYIDTVANNNYNFAKEYSYINKNLYPYEIKSNDFMAIKNTEVIYRFKNNLESVNVLAVYGNFPKVNIINGEKPINKNEILVSESLKKIKIGQTIEIYKENAQKQEYIVSGKYQSSGIEDENHMMIMFYNSIKNSLFDSRFSNIYSNNIIKNSVFNTKSYYTNSASYNVQTAATLLIEIIGFILSFLAVINTFAVIMSVRKKEFNGLKIIGAKKFQLFKMTCIETLIVTFTGAIIGFAIYVACVGTYSYQNTGVFNWIVNEKMLGILMFTIIGLGFIAGIIPSLLTILKIKREFRVE